MQLLITFLVTLAVLLIAFMLINISYIVKGRPFRGTCAQNNPLLKNQIGDCSACGKKGDKVCQLPEAKA